MPSRQAGKGRRPWGPRAGPWREEDKAVREGWGGSDTGTRAPPGRGPYLLGGHGQSRGALPPPPRDTAALGSHRAERKQLHSLGRWPFRSGSPQHTASPRAQWRPGPCRASEQTARHRARCPGGSPGPPAGGRAGAGALRGEAAVGEVLAPRPGGPAPLHPHSALLLPSGPYARGSSGQLGHQHGSRLVPTRHQWPSCFCNAFRLILSPPRAGLSQDTRDRGRSPQHVPAAHLPSRGPSRPCSTCPSFTPPSFHLPEPPCTQPLPAPH